VFGLSNVVNFAASQRHLPVRSGEAKGGMGKGGGGGVMEGGGGGGG